MIQMRKQTTTTVETVLHPRFYNTAGFVVFDSIPDVPELPFAAVWHDVHESEPGTAFDAERAARYVSQDGFGTFIHYPTQAEAAAAVLRPMADVVAEILG